MAASVAISRSNNANDGPESCPLFMDCVDEAPSEAQEAQRAREDRAFRETILKLEALAKTATATSRNADGSLSIHTGTTEIVQPGAPVAQPAPQAAVSTPPVAAPTTNVRLLMDPRTGRILGTLPNQGAAAPAATQATPRSLPVIRPVPTATTSPAPNLVPVPPPVGRGLSVTRSTSQASKRASQPQTVDLTRSASHAAPSSQPPRPGQKLPCLQVQPKPQKTGTNLAAKKSELDTKVKQLLVMTPPKFTEWLMQQGLILQEQNEFLSNGTKVKLKLAMHSDGKRFANSGGYVWVQEKQNGKFTSVFRGSIFDTIGTSPTVILKLMYHWVCQTSLQNVQTWVNVSQQTMDTHFRHFRAVALASVHEDVGSLGGPGKIVEIGVISLGTTSADGARREVRVEVLGVMERSSGKIRLRATEPSRGPKPQSQAERHAQIFKPVPQWVHQSSKIIIDTSVDKERLKRMGFPNVIQTNARVRPNDPNSNVKVMEYLKKVVPKMFQNSLSSLSTTQIQEFLDELSFREIMGYYPLLCFNTLLEKIAFQTSVAASFNRFGKTSTLLERLSSVTKYPFADWVFHTSSSTAAAPNSPPTPTYGIDALPPSLRMIDSPAASPSPPPAAPSSPYRVQSYGTKRPASANPAANAPMIKKPKEMVQLETYFYSRLPGDPNVLSGEFKADMAFKCHLCKKVYMNNIEFARHLSLHIESVRAAAVDLVDLCQCKYCFKDFDTPFAMQTHLEEIHWKKGFDCVCRICEEGFKNKGGFIQHMAVVHAKYEMPYSCAICGFRSSFHNDIVDHFQEAHDRSDKLQCPRCLKTFSLFSNNQYNANVASSYVNHLQSHVGKKYTCRKCCLTFVTDQDRATHMRQDHVSYSNIKNLEPYEYQAGEEPTQMPKPDERGWKQASRGGYSGSGRAAQQQAAFAAQNLDDVAMYDMEGNEDCGECGRKFVNKQHFAAYLCCTKCRYSTCCSRAMSLHISIFHGARAKPEFDLGQPVILNREMFCCCGFYAKSGNKMAKHLSLNNCRTAYPTAEAAKSAVQTLSSASFAPLVSLEEEGERSGSGADGDVASFDPSVVMAQAYQKDKGRDKEQAPSSEQQGPLAFLGLQQRRSSLDGGDSAAPSGAEDDTARGDEDGEGGGGSSDEV